MICLNKKAGEKILSIWWFFCLILVGAITVLVITTYFGAFVDTRGIDANSMYEKIMDCIVKNGYLNAEFLTMENEKILEICNLNKKAFEESGPFFFHLRIYKEDKELKSFQFGNVYEKDCLAAAGYKAKNYPSCAIANETVIYFNETSAEKEIFKIYLITASNNMGYKQSIRKKGDNNQ